MLSLVYNLALIFLGICALPKLLWYLVKTGKYRQSFKNRLLGIDLPPLENGNYPIIWIHAVSMGETRAALPLYHKILSHMPEATLIVSTMTEAGYKEAKRSMPQAKVHFFLPLDFSWLMKKVVKKYKPNLLLLVEGEFWYHLLTEVKRSGASIALVNGKLSDRSSKRFSKVPFFARKLFSPIDLFCVQNEEYKERFFKLGVPTNKIHVTGNLKLDLTPPAMPPEQVNAFKNELGISSEDRIITIGSTHEGEEDALIDILAKLYAKQPELNLKIILVPRHPERFPLVEKLLKHKKISSLTYSKRESKTGNEDVILMDAMGVLNKCYQLSEIALVGGSFVKGIGGHNIFEPIAFGVPVLFGPYMETQPDLTKFVLKTNSGQQVPLEKLSDTLHSLLTHSDKWRDQARLASKQAHEVTEKTLTALFPFILNRK